MKLNIYKRLALILTSCLVMLNIANATSHKNATYFEDAEITIAIYTKYVADPVLDPLDINVETKNGVVSLIGQLQTTEQRHEAITIARETDGVKGVNADDLLVVTSDQPMTDLWITTKVKAVLLKEQLINNRKIAALHVETTNGIVYLSGEATKADAAYAEKVVKKIKGLEDSVVNQIKIIK